ncbi:8937_t:CDS:2, partial [Racocetra persica]
QIKDINNIIEMLIKEYFNNAHENSAKNLEKELNELFELLQTIELDRYLTLREKTIKSNGFFQMLFKYNDYNFKQITRVSKETFMHLENLIHDNPVFLNKSEHLQRPVWQQLAVTLERLGCNENSASIGRFARQWGLGIGTVVEYTKRVITAINSIGNDYVQWPNFIERQQISERMEISSGFKGCIGFLDGTDVILEYKPSKDGETYYRSVTDSTAYKSTPLFQNTQNFFKEGEYLLADCGYQLTSTTIIPYRQPYANIPENAVFNELLAKERVRIEHVNGICERKIWLFKWNKNSNFI